MANGIGIPPRMRYPIRQPDKEFARQQHLSFLLTKYDIVECLSHEQWSKFHNMIWEGDEEMLNLAEVILTEKIKEFENGI